MKTQDKSMKREIFKANSIRHLSMIHLLILYNEKTFPPNLPVILKQNYSNDEMSLDTIWTVMFQQVLQPHTEVWPVA